MTSKELAVELGVSLKTVQKWASIFGFKTYGRDFHFTEEQAARIRDRGDKRYGRKNRRSA